MINHRAESEKAPYAELVMKDAKLQSSSWALVLIVLPGAALMGNGSRQSSLDGQKGGEKPAGAL